MSYKLSGKLMHDVSGMLSKPDISRRKKDNAEFISKKKLGSDYVVMPLEELHEGLSAQIMHIGPYSEEHGNIMKIHELIRIIGGSFKGTTQKHHEIYISDFRKTAPEKLKTVLRQPFVR